MTAICFLDIATVTGMAWDGPEGHPTAMSYRAPAPVGDKEDGFDFGPTFHGYRDWLIRQIKFLQPRVLAYEAPLHVILAAPAVGPGGKPRMRTSPHTVRLLVGLVAHTDQIATELGVKCVEVTQAAIKKHFTGHGHADKDDLKARCRQLGWEFGNDNESDALGGWSFVMSTINPNHPHLSQLVFPVFGAGQKLRA
jgi:hypothetical protein